MSRTYAQITTLVLQMLQDTGAATYDSTETGYAIEESLKEFAHYDPHIVPVVFKIESRHGTDVTGTEGSLTDAVKDQFVGTDDDNEKVIHNTTDNTWAVVKTYTDETVLVLTADIMDANENYEIYHRRCHNNKQIYLGNWGDYQWPIADYLWVDSVEYPIGTKRNFKVYDDVLEIDVNTVVDSNLNVTTLPNIDALVRFAVPHRLLQLTDTHGALVKDEVAGAVAFPFKGFTDGQTIEVGDEFHIGNHRSLYTCTEAIALSNQASAGSVCHFFPPLEAAASEDDYINFRVSTLQPQHEELFCHLVAARALMSEANAQLIQAKADFTTGRALINTIPKGGPGATVPNAYMNYARAGEDLARAQREMGERKLGEVLNKLDRISTPRTKRVYPKD